MSKNEDVVISVKSVKSWFIFINFAHILNHWTNRQNAQCTYTQQRKHIKTKQIQLQAPKTKNK
jgi:hypothetical protein